METYTREQTETAVESDPAARELLRGAFERTARWQPDFQGFQADLCVNVNGAETRGSVTVKGPKDVTVELEDEELKKWAQDQIGMMAVHRGPRTFDESDGKYALTLDGGETHPLGQRVNIHGDGMGSWYRVRNNRIQQINRKTPHIGFTINVEESMLTEDDKNLTTKYTVYYYAPKDGALRNVESFSDSHVRIAASDLPATRRILSYENNEVIVKTLVFENHRML